MVSDAINCEVMLATPSNFKQTDLHCTLTSVWDIGLQYSTHYLYLIVF